MKIGSLFSGYLGLDMAAEAYFGAETAWVSDIDPGASNILAHRTTAPNLGDITQIDWTTVEPVDIITGGFPCQDLSHAGKRAGLRAGTRSGLWSHMATAIETIRPRYVVAENVRGLLSASAASDLEQCPWCMGGAADGEPNLRALGCVLGDLADIGYSAQWCGLRAADVGAPHGRFRVFVVATDTRRPDRWGTDASGRSDSREQHSAAPRRLQSAGAFVGGGGVAEDTDRTVSDQWWQSAPGQTESGWARADTGRPDRAPASDPGGQRHGGGEDTRGLGCVDGENASQTPQRQRSWTLAGDRSATATADTPGATRRGPQPDHLGETARPTAELGKRSGTYWGAYEPAIRRWERTVGRVAPAPTETSPKGSQRLSPAFVEWMMGLPAGWVTDVPRLNRNAQLKALGNGVVPQQAYAALQSMLGAGEVAA